MDPDSMFGILEPQHDVFELEDPQDQSPFFQLPGEVRDRIYCYALASYDDTKQRYDENTYWARPQTTAPQVSDISLLKCCKRIYNESWFYPWAARDHNFWLTDHLRAPEQRMDKKEFANALKFIQERHGDVHLEHVRFFAQLYMLEDGNALSEYLTLSHFHPRCITVSIRHTDWWEWERDAWLRIDSTWVDNCKLPLSVRQFKMELETVIRKKDQLDAIIRQMKENWYFTRVDNVHLSSRNTPVEITRWRGTSIWAGQRWIRDETEPEVLDYYVATVSWEFDPLVTLEGMKTPECSVSGEQYKVMPAPGALLMAEVYDAKVPRKTPVAKALEMIRAFRDANGGWYAVYRDRYWN